MPDSVKNEFHDLAEVKLNRSGEHWGNLGYWQFDNHYSDACRQLALELGEFAGLGKQQRLFDAGFGCGDQILVWYKAFEAEYVTGVNLSVSQTEVARHKLQESGYQQRSDIHYGDIGKIQRPAMAGQFDRVLALDCIYHFSNKRQFFSQSYDLSNEQGVLAFSDLLLVDGAKDNWRYLLVKIMLWLSNIPQQNLTNLDDLQQQLKQQGFGFVEHRDISVQVMPAFYSWYLNNRSELKEKLNLADRLKYLVTGSFLNWAYKNKLIRYVLVKASKETSGK